MRASARQSPRHSPAATLLKNKIDVQDPSGKLPGHKLRQATDYINQNLRNDLSLGKISEALCMSPYHFAHVFKQTTGLAPHRYVIECRMKRRRHSCARRFRISEIARMVGYSTQSHFSMVFRQLTGCLRRATAASPNLHPLREGYPLRVTSNPISDVVPRLRNSADLVHSGNFVQSGRCRAARPHPEKGSRISALLRRRTAGTNIRKIA